MADGIDWALGVNSGPSAPASVMAGFQLGRQQRDQIDLRRALGVLTASPDDPAARSVVGALDPHTLAGMDTENWQRQAHSKDTAFDAAFADYQRSRLTPASVAPAVPAASPAAPVAPAPSSAVAALLGGDGTGSALDYTRTAPVADVPRGLAASGGLRGMPGTPRPADDGLAPIDAAPAGSGLAGLLTGSGSASAPATAPAQSAAVPAPVPAAASASATSSTASDEAFARMLAANPEKAMLVRQNEVTQRAATMKAKLDLLDTVNEHGIRLLAGATDQASYDAAVSQYQALRTQNGIPAAQLPATYSPQTVQALQATALSVKDQIETARQAATLAETHRHNVADEDKTKFAPIKLKNAQGGEDVWIFDQATGKMVNTGSGGGGGGGGGGNAKGGFDAAMAFILPHEGGFAPSDGNGQPVNFGINQGANPGVDVKHLTRDGAVQIYRDKYWAQSGADKLPENAQTAYFDTYIINPERAKALWQHSGGDVNKFLDLRDGWLNGLIADNPGKYGRFQKAWTARTNDLRTLVGGGDDGESDAPASSGGATPAGGLGKPLIHTEGPPNGGLSAEEINFYAQDVANGGDMPQLGMGKDAAMARQAILKQAAKIGMGQGRDGTDFGVRRAEVKGIKTGLQALERQAGPVLAFERTAQRNGALALSLADKVGNTGVPVLNKWINAGRQAVAGDPDVTSFHAAVETFANEFAKLTSTATGGGVTSDQARAHVYAMVNRDQSPAQFKATMQVLYQDMANRRQGIADQRQELLGRIQGRGTPAASASPPAGGYPTLTPEQVRAAPSGTVFRTTDGRTMRKR